VELTEKNLNRNILSLAVPAAVENLLYMMVFITDTMFMAWVGTKQLAGVDISAMIAGILMLFVMAVSTAAMSLVARHIGAKKQREAEQIAGQALSLGFVAAVLVAAPVMIFAPQLLRLMGLEPAVVAFGVIYLRTVMLTAGFRQIISGGCSTLRGAGDTRTPMFITLIMNIVNIAAAYLLVLGKFGFPRLEVRGAAYAANLASLVGAGLVLFVLLRGRRAIQVHLRDVFSFHRPALAMLIRIGLPAGLDMFAMRISFLLYYRIIASLGTDALAANAVALRVESLSFMPGMGIAMAAATLVGQSLGAGQVGLAEKSLKRCTWMAGALMAVLGLVLLVAARPVSALFVADPKMIALSALCIQISAFEQPLLGFVMVYMGGLRGAGDTLSAMMVTLICSTLVRLPVVFFLAITLHLGLVGAWLGAVVDWAFRSVVVYWIARRGRWKRIKVDISAAPVPAEEIVTETVAIPPAS